MTKWIGPAAWAKQEARAGDRLPYRRHIGPQTIELRDGAAMRTIHVAGLPFETEAADALNQMLGVREVVLRAALDARFVLYHHVVRRRVDVSLDAAGDALSADIGRRWSERLSDRRLFVNEQFLTLVRRPARGKSGWPERLARLGRSKRDNVPDPANLRALDAAITGLIAALSSYGARPLALYAGANAVCSEPLELLSALYNGEMHPVAAPGEDVDLGHHVPYARVSFGLDAIETRSSGTRSFASILGIREYPDATAPGIIDGLLRLPFELVLTETFAPADRQIARERIDLALRRLRSADEEAAAERRETHWGPVRRASAIII